MTEEKTKENKEVELTIEVALRQGRKVLGAIVVENQADFDEFKRDYNSYNKLKEELANQEIADAEDDLKKLQEKIKEREAEIKKLKGK